MVLDTMTQSGMKQASDGNEKKTIENLWVYVFLIKKKDSYPK